MTQDTHPGLWSVEYLGAVDHNDNSVYYYGSRTDLSAANFTVENPDADIAPPVIDLSTLSVSLTTAQPGDVVQIKFKMTDEESGVYRAAFSLTNENGGSYYKPIYTPDLNGYYTMEMPVTQDTHTGLWKIDYLVGEDLNDNSIYYYGFSTDLSAADFTVVDGSNPENPINAEVVTSNTTWNYKTVDRDVYVGPDAILTINGDVRVNGNIYVLGGVVSYGDLTAVGVYAHSFNFGTFTGTVYQGSFNVVAGSHSIETMTSSTYPIPNIPIEVYSSNVVSPEGYLTEITGATLPIGDLYLEDQLVDYNYNGTFSLRDYYVGTKSVLNFKIVDVFGKPHYFDFVLDNPNAATLESLEIVSPPDKVRYIVGQDLDLTGLEVAGVFSDGERVPMEVKPEHVSGFDSSTPQIGQIITVTLEGKSATFTVDIVEKSLTSIAISQLPDKTTYFIGEALDLTGLQVTGTYDDGSSAPVEVTADHISGFNSNSITGIQTVTVTVEGLTATFDVEIIRKSLQSIAITRMPAKTAYYTGEPLSVSDIEVTGTYDDGSTVIIPYQELGFVGFDSSTAVSGQIVTVIWEGKTTTFTVDIIGRYMFDISIRQLPKVFYLVGEQLDLSSIEVVGFITDGTEVTIPVLDLTITGFDSSQPGIMMVTVEYQGFTDQFEVEVAAKVAQSLYLERNPDKTEYLVGDALDLTGMELVAQYNDHSQQIVPLDEIEVTGFDSSKPEEFQAVTLSHLGASLTIWVTIRQKSNIQVYAGANRYQTASLISQSMYDQADTAILVQATNFPDALAAGPLAYALDAPILLTETNALSSVTLQELNRLGVKKVILMGGTLVISSKVETTLKTNFAVERIAGANRYETAVLAAQRLKDLRGTPTQAFVTSGLQFPDALSAGSYAASGGYSLLLTDGKTLSKNAISFIQANQISQITLMGGHLVIESSVADQLESIGVSVYRMGGTTRTGTSAMMASGYFAQATDAIAANGWTFPDALAAIPMAAKLKAPILLVGKDIVDQPIRDYLEYSSVLTIHVVGGELVISSAVRSQLLNLIQ